LPPSRVYRDEEDAISREHAACRKRMLPSGEGVISNEDGKKRPDIYVEYPKGLKIQPGRRGPVNRDNAKIQEEEEEEEITTDMLDDATIELISASAGEMIRTASRNTNVAGTSDPANADPSDPSQMVRVKLSAPPPGAPPVVLRRYMRVLDGIRERSEAIIEEQDHAMRAERRRKKERKRREQQRGREQPRNNQHTATPGEDIITISSSEGEQDTAHGNNTRGHGRGGGNSAGRGRGTNRRRRNRTGGNRGRGGGRGRQGREGGRGGSKSRYFS